MAPVLGRRGIKLTALHKNAMLHIDRELFLSLLYNLIDNAAKASPDNSEIWLIQSELDGHTVVSVIDRGMGMKPDTVRRATEAFYMEDKARSRKAGGAGLGLALCDDICRRHGARLEIRSTYQEGHHDYHSHECSAHSEESGRRAGSAFAEAPAARENT